MDIRLKRHELHLIGERFEIDWSVETSGGEVETHEILVNRTEAVIVLVVLVALLSIANPHLNTTALWIAAENRLRKSGSRR